MTVSIRENRAAASRRPRREAGGWQVAEWPMAIWPMLVALAMLCGAGEVRAELVILSDGSFVKVDDFRVVGSKIELDLPSGGLLVMPLTRVDRILDDEIVTQEEPPPAEPVGFKLRFAEQDVPQVPFGEAIHVAAQRHGLNPALVAEVVRAESSFRERVVSVKGAQGLMQLMPSTAERFGLTGDQAFQPELNLDAGCRYLRWLADRFEDDLPRVLAAYNAGEGAVGRYNGVPPYRETRNYVAKILKALGVSDDQESSLAAPPASSPPPAKSASE